MRTAESGHAMTYHFCPTCGSTLYWENDGFPGQITVAIGNFADPNFPAPTIAVWSNHVIPGSSCRPKRRPSAWRSSDKIARWAAKGSLEGWLALLPKRDREQAFDARIEA
jgi:hypothetical protein